jgi:hypothetical protein
MVVDGKIKAIYSRSKIVYGRVKMGAGNNVSDLRVFRLCTSIGCDHRVLVTD